MTDHEHQERLASLVQVVPPPPGVPPAHVHLTGTIINDDGAGVLEEQLWVVGYIDPLLNLPVAGQPVVLTGRGALPLGTYIHVRGITDHHWSLIALSPSTVLEQQEQMRLAAQNAMGGPRIQVAGAFTPPR